MYTADDTSPVADGEKLYQVVVAVNNPTDKVMSSSEFTITATVDGVPVEAVHPTGGPIDQPIQPNVQLNIPFLFKVKDGTSGQLRSPCAAVTASPCTSTATCRALLQPFQVGRGRTSAVSP